MVDAAKMIAELERKDDPKTDENVIAREVTQEKYDISVAKTTN